MKTLKSFNIGCCFFLLPIALFAGKASQASGLYLFAFLLPLIFFWHQRLNIAPKVLAQLGLCLVGCYAVFPLFNFLQIPWQPLPIARRTMLESQLSSAVFVSGWFLLLLAWRNSRNRERPLITPTPLKNLFIAGAAIGALLLAIWVTFELTTGHHFAALADLRVDRRLPNGLYRVAGFEIHPIPFAGMALAWFGFFWSLFWTTAADAVKRNRIFLGITALLFFYFIIASGSRIAAGIALMLLLGVPLLSKSLSWKRKLTVVGVLGGLFVALAMATGLVYRFAEIFSDSIVGGLGERPFFWRVHWQIFLENPWIGAGAGYLKEGLRDVYYEQMGMAGFDKKYNAHNLYLETLADVGILGFVLLLTLACTFLCRTQRLFKENGLTAAFFTAVIAVLIFGLTQNALFDTPIIFALAGMWWLMFWESIA